MRQAKPVTITAMGVWQIMALLCSLAQGGAGVPALTESQAAQLATARDYSPRWDEAALYPLLTNVVQWSAGDEAGATVPDYAKLHTAPAEFRGQLFLIEGQLGAAPSLVKRQLSRPGAWDTNLQQWDVLVERDPDEAVVLVLADPLPPEQLPRRGGQTVRAAARFYKVWSYVDRNNQPTDYLMFVGRSVRLTPTGAGGVSPGTSGGVSGGGGTSGGGWTFGVVLLVLVAAWYAFWRLRRLTQKPRPRPSISQPLSHHLSDEDIDQDPSDQPLPDDPAEALRELQRRAEKDTASPGE